MPLHHMPSPHRWGILGIPTCACSLWSLLIEALISDMRSDTSRTWAVGHSVMTSSSSSILLQYEFITVPLPFLWVPVLVQQTSPLLHYESAFYCIFFLYSFCNLHFSIPWLAVAKCCALFGNVSQIRKLSRSLASYVAVANCQRKKTKFTKTLYITFYCELQWSVIQNWNLRDQKLTKTGI